MPPAVPAILGLAALGVGFLLNLILPGQRPFAWAVLAIGAALLAAAATLDVRRADGTIKTRRGRFGIGATVEICLFVGIVAALNAIGVSVFWRFDYTGLAQFTLTSQTQDVLRELDAPVEIVSFFTPGATAPVKNYAESLLAEYERYTNQITVRSVDPDLSPDQAREYGVEQLGALLGVLVFTGDAGQKRVFGPEVTAAAEHAFTGAILEVTGKRQKKVLFVIGHGERNLSFDYSAALAGLRDNLFEVGEIDLLATPNVPADAACLVIAGPRRPVGADEIETLRTYLSGGGRVLVLLDPGSFGGLIGLLSEWSLDLEAGTLVDLASHVAPAADAILVPRARNALGLPTVYFPGATAVRTRPGAAVQVEITPLAWTSDESWLERSPLAGNPPTFDPGADVKGPFAIGALLAKDAGADGKARLAVIGDSDFAANQHFGSANNGDLLVTVVNWLTEDASVIEVDRRPLAMRRLVLTPEEARLLHVSAIGLLPLVLFAAGGIVWWMRR